MNEAYPVTLYWPRGVSRQLHESICKSLDITLHMTVNRETVVHLTVEQAEKMEKLREQGLLIVRKKRLNKMR